MVSKRKPRSVKKRQGTPLNQAAIPPSRPAFGVPTLVIVGRSARITRYRHHSVTRSDKTAMSRAIGISMVVTPSTLAASRFFPAEEMTTTSNPLSRRYGSWPCRARTVQEAVTTFSTMGRLELMTILEPCCRMSCTCQWPVLGADIIKEVSPFPGLSLPTVGNHLSTYLEFREASGGAERLASCCPDCRRAA